MWLYVCVGVCGQLFWYVNSHSASTSPVTQYSLQFLSSLAISRGKLFVKPFTR